MEADWEFEIGSGAPVIEGHWSGFVDLRAQPERASELSECNGFPPLAEALVRLNRGESPVWTSKIDVFTPDQIDADEMAASADEAAHAIACYIDLLPAVDQLWNVPSKAERACREICANLRAIELSRCRVDLVVRRAIAASAGDVGITAYLCACGATETVARERLGECLASFTEVLVSARS